jgi:hypothetical protein
VYTEGAHRLEAKILQKASELRIGVVDPALYAKDAGVSFYSGAVTESAAYLLCREKSSALNRGNKTLAHVPVAVSVGDTVRIELAFGVEPAASVVCSGKGCSGGAGAGAGADKGTSGSNSTSPPAREIRLTCWNNDVLLGTIDLGTASSTQPPFGSVYGLSFAVQFFDQGDAVVSCLPTWQVRRRGESDAVTSASLWRVCFRGKYVDVASVIPQRVWRRECNAVGKCGVVASSSCVPLPKRDASDCSLSL